jgi:microcystin-dependent protein
MQVFVGQLLLVGFNFAPVGWAFCNGALVPISQYEALFNLIGTTYGGDGQNTFGLPDLRGRTPIATGQLQGGGNYVLGQPGGAENVTIASSNYPTHNHLVNGVSSGATSSSPGGMTLAGSRSIYVNNTAASVALNPAMVGPSIPTAGGGPHANLQPYQTLNWIISLYGIFPTPS